MKSYYLTLLFSFTVTFALCQPDTTAVARRLKLLETQLVKTNDSLKRELQDYKNKEGLYSDVLSSQASNFSAIISTQTGIFSIIVTAILALVGGLTLYGYSNLKKQVETYKEYVDNKAAEILKDGANSLKVLKNEADKREILRLTNSYDFYSFLEFSSGIGGYEWGKEDRESLLASISFSTQLNKLTISYQLAEVNDENSDKRILKSMSEITNSLLFLEKISKNHKEIYGSTDNQTTAHFRGIVEVALQEITRIKSTKNPLFLDELIHLQIRLDRYLKKYPKMEGDL